MYIPVPYRAKVETARTRVHNQERHFYTVCFRDGTRISQTFAPSFSATADEAKRAGRKILAKWIRQERMQDRINGPRGFAA